MKHFGITVSRLIIKSGNKLQAFDDLVATYYFIWLGFSNFPHCLPYVSSQCSMRGERQNICIFICFPAICVSSQAHNRVMVINNTQAEHPSYSQIVFHCRLIIQNKHSNVINCHPLISLRALDDFISKNTFRTSILLLPPSAACVRRTRTH